MIVVGVDGSSGSARALAWAADEALAHGHTLRVVHGWAFHDLPLALAESTNVDIEAAAHQLVTYAVGSIDPSITVETVVSNELPAAALIEASRGADLLVVGSRGAGGFKGLLIGSVSMQCVHHAHCPVVVVPDPRRD